MFKKSLELYRNTLKFFTIWFNYIIESYQAHEVPRCQFTRSKLVHDKIKHCVVIHCCIYSKFENRRSPQPIYCIPFFHCSILLIILSCFVILLPEIKIESKSCFFSLYITLIFLLFLFFSSMYVMHNNIKQRHQDKNSSNPNDYINYIMF